MRKSQDNGFTLIELLVVIIILALLVGIAIPVFLRQREKGYDAQAKSDLRNVATLQESYLTSYGSYSMTIDPTCASAADRVCYRRSSNTSAVAGSYVDLTGTATATPGATMYGYCLWTTADSGRSWYYNSLRGGLQAAAGC